MTTNNISVTFVLTGDFDYASIFTYTGGADTAMRSRRTRAKTSEFDSKKAPFGASLYNDSVQEAADAYADGGWEDVDAVPSMVGLAHHLRIDLETLRRWTKRHKRFALTHGRIISEQHRTALNLGLKGTFNPSICKLVLANHGYYDRVSQEHISPDGSMSPPKRIELVAPNVDE